MKTYNLSIGKPKIKQSLNYRFIAALLLVSALSGTGFAQQNSLGIYKSVQDFKNKQLSYSAFCNERRNKIKLNELFNRAFITVHHNGERIKLKKADVYGYRDCDNNDYRLVGGTKFKVLNTDKICIYSRIIMGSGDTGYADEFYFFSVDPGTKIFQLNKTNLINAYPDNEKFRNLIDITFGDYQELDVFSKEYLIVKLYKDSIK